MAADHGAFLPDTDCRVEPTGCGALHGLTFAVKDLIDVAGHVTGGGNPDWAAAQQPAALHAPAVASLLAAGARLRGKTISDELAFSLEGENAHYGTPRNPRCPDRLPGGSSSGSAVAVAAGLNDLALGTDTGGSVRVPASFCGIYGFRPSHGRVPLAGVVPFAPSYDTVGLFAGSARHLALAGRVLLGSLNQTTPMPPPITRFYHATDAFALAQPATAAALPRLGEAVTVFDGAEADWLEAYRVLQGIEIKASLGPWIARAAPRFGANIAPRFAEALALSETDAAQWRPRRAAFAARLHALLAPGSALLLPSAPGPALPCDADGAMRGEFYRAALTLGSLAGHAGLPALSLPGTLVAGCPVGLSIIAGPGQDEALLAFAVSNALEHDVIML